jgi:hypothetical protein
MHRPSGLRLLVLALLSLAASGRSQCAPPPSGGRLAGGVVIRSADLSNSLFAASQQRCLLWCWAAGCETLTHQWGHILLDYDTGWPISQEWFAGKVYGSLLGLQCLPATSPAQVAQALTGRYAICDPPNFTYPEIRLTGRDAYAPFAWAAQLQMVKLIQNKSPFIVCYGTPASWHALVAYRIEWYEDSVSGAFLGLKALQITDPFPIPWYALLGQTPDPTYLSEALLPYVWAIVWVDSVRP